MTVQNTGRPTEEPDGKLSTPAKTWFAERQAQTGALAAEGAQQDTSQDGSQGSASAGGQAGGGTPAPSATPDPIQASLDRLAVGLEKMAERQNNQANYLTQLTTKIDQQRVDFEKRFRSAPRGKQGDDGDGGESDPPAFDLDELTGTVVKRVTDQVGEFLRPLVTQTRDNALINRITQAMQSNPNIEAAVKQLPPAVRANLTERVKEVAGDRLFKESSGLFEEEDPVVEALGYIHYRTVVQAGGRPAVQAGTGAEAQPRARTGDGRFSPVPSPGSPAARSGLSEEAEEASKLFGMPVGRAQYPPNIARELGIR